MCVCESIEIFSEKAFEIMFLWKRNYFFNHRTMVRGTAKPKNMSNSNHCY